MTFSLHYRLLTVVGGLVLAFAPPSLAQLERTSPVAPPNSPATPNGTLPEIVPCDKDGKPIGSKDDKIVAVPTPSGTPRDEGAVIAPPPGTPEDKGAVIAPEKAVGTPSNLPRCTPQPARSTPDQPR
ncbi:hypothetical protein [Gloeobacter morelensis]|uniref:Uncharacterized protein n=1 Tax=Gloeobacter morelensis MG652769 TaxID=2781736 RepID=A0ABY3PQT5_9CYAN|nr:hypothetical protein [Gloeobacter morelensis]UFP95898.1 hypothetical protein ISF26_06665 [Gloeobacter morelensis MG652769]